MGTTYTINCDNPFLSASQRTLLCGSATATGDASALVGYRAANGEPRRDYLRHTYNRFNVGFKGEINDAFSYDVNYLSAKTNYKENYLNDINQARAQNALEVVDVNGVPTCKVTVSGADANCVPIDVFSFNGPSKEAWEYLYAPTFTSSDQSMSIFTATLNADFGKYNVKTPWADDGVAAVFGYEKRKEDYVFVADEIMHEAGTKDADGKIGTNEFFAELSVPVVQNKKFIDKLELELGYRLSKYEAKYSKGSSPDLDADTYKFGIQYSPEKDLLLRVSYNKATRAANISELFQAQSIGNVSAEDPCSGASPLASLAQCQLSGVTTAQYGYITECPASTCSALSGGNPDLKPEQAETITAGFVYTPKKIPGLLLSLDYFTIKVDDYINGVDAGMVINECIYNSNDYFCGLIKRDASSGNLFGNNSGYIIGTQMNTGYLKTSGFDFNGNYRIATSDIFDKNYGKLDFSMVGTYTTEKETQQLPGFTPYDCVGYFGNTCGQPSPKWRHSFRTTWIAPELPMTLSLNWRFIGETKLYDTDPPAINKSIKAYNYFDLAGTYDFGKNVNIRYGVNNMFDKNPPAIAYGLLNELGNGNTYPGTYSSLGRTFFIGLTAQY